MFPTPFVSPVAERPVRVPLPWWRRWRTRLFAAFLLLALAAGSITRLETWRTARAAEASARDAQARAARSLAETVRLVMDRYRLAAATLAGTLPARSRPAPDRRAWLEGVQTALPEAVVLVTDGSGRVTDASHPRAVGIDVSDRACFRRLAAGEPSTAVRLDAGEVSAEPRVGVAVAARAADGALLGTVAVLVPARVLAREIGPLVPTGSSAHVLDQDGRAVLPGPDPLAGRPSVSALAPVPELGWSVGILRLPDGREAAPGGLRGMLAGLFAVVGLALGLAAVLSGRLARPLTALSRGVAALQRGEFGHRVRVAGGDEFAALAESFNRMAADLATYVDALRESEARLEAILRSTPAVIYLMDAENRFVHVNRQFEALFETSAGDLRGRSVHDVFPAETAAAFEANNREVLEAGRPIEFEERVRLADGVHVYRSIKAPLAGADGRPVGLAGVSVDITATKRAEAERGDLLAREQRARAEAEAARAEALAATAELARANEALQQRLIQIQTLLEVSPVGIGMAEDPEGRSVLANPALGRMLGVEPWSNISTSAPPGPALPFTFLRDGRPLEPGELPLRRALARGVPVGDTEVEVVTGDGRRLHLLEWATPFFDARGRVRGGFLAVVDITERTRAERSLRFLAEASAILASSLDWEATVGLVTRLAVPAIADWCFVDLVAGASTRRVGLAHADPARAEVAAALRRFAPGRDGAHPVAAALAGGRAQLLTEVDDAWLRAIAGGDDAHYQALRALGPGSWLTVPLTAREHSLGALTLIAAESGRRYGVADVALAEELARRVAVAIDNARLYREAQEAVRVRELFFAAASHELRTPLTSAVGALRLVKRAMAGQLREAPETLIDLANRSLDAMLVLLNDLLDATRLSARPDTLAREPVSLGPLVAGALDLVAPQARESGIAIDVAVPADLTAAGDPDRLEQVIVNLLANAVHHSRAGGTVTVEGRAEGDGIVLRVRDEGDGLAAEDLERVFEPFVRAHPRLGGRKAGTGLGLAICRQIVTLHGGRIWAESEGVGRGSTFSVTLPGAPAGRRAA